MLAMYASLLVLISFTCAVVARRLQNTVVPKEEVSELKQLLHDSFEEESRNLFAEHSSLGSIVQAEGDKSPNALAGYLLSLPAASHPMGVGRRERGSIGRIRNSGSRMILDPFIVSDFVNVAPLVGSVGSLADALAGATTNGESILTSASTAAAVGGGVVDIPLAEVLMAPITHAVAVIGEAIGGAAALAVDMAAAASSAFAPAAGVAALTSALSSYRPALEPQVDEWLEEAALVEDFYTRNVSSFMSVASWPKQRIFTFGECAFRGNWSGDELHVPGARVVISTDPVPTLVGQAIGYRHSRMVPVIDLDGPETDGADVSIGHDFQFQDNVSVDKLAIANLANEKVPAQREAAQKVELEQPSTVLSDIKKYGLKIFTESDWGSHDLGFYASQLKQLIGKSDGRKRRKENLETYRMSMLTRMMSYVDANTSNVEAALEKLNAEMDPINPKRPLFQHKLEHVMTFPFYTSCDLVSRALHPLGDRFGPQAPISREGIAHNVHLLRDSANHGYLTFQGTTNLGTWVDVNFAFGAYDPTRSKISFDTVVDDKRWAMVEGHYLQNCHTGFCNTLKALLSNKRFPLLANEVSRMKSITLLGHSFGGSLASMLVRSAHGAKILRKQEGVLARVRRLLPFRRRRKNQQGPVYHPR